MTPATWTDRFSRDEPARPSPRRALTDPNSPRQASRPSLTTCGTSPANPALPEKKHARARGGVSQIARAHRPSTRVSSVLSATAGTAERGARRQGYSLRPPVLCRPARAVRRPSPSCGCPAWARARARAGDGRETRPLLATLVGRTWVLHAVLHRPAHRGDHRGPGTMGSSGAVDAGLPVSMSTSSGGRRTSVRLLVLECAVAHWAM